MPKSRFNDIFKNRRPHVKTEGITERDPEQELWARLDATMSGLAGHLAEDRIDSIVSTFSWIAENDNQAGWILLEKFPDIVTGLRRAGVEIVM